MRNVKVGDKFEDHAGTELPPMSSTTDLGIASGYAYGDSKSSIIFRIITKNRLQRGADLQWLSAFPNESEVLFSPLTYMQPTGRKQKISVGQSHFTVVEVETTTA